MLRGEADSAWSSFGLNPNGKSRMRKGGRGSTRFPHRTLQSDREEPARGVIPHSASSALRWPFSVALGTPPSQPSPLGQKNATNVNSRQQLEF